MVGVVAPEGSEEGAPEVRSVDSDQSTEGGGERTAEWIEVRSAVDDNDVFALITSHFSSSLLMIGVSKLLLLLVLSKGPCSMAGEVDGERYGSFTPR
jgi:hypothetical protein